MILVKMSLNEADQGQN